MIDPGHPFSKPYQDVIASLEESIRFGVEQPERRAFTFKSTITSYELPQTIFDVTRVTGLIGKAFTIFSRGRDYQFSNNRLSWIASTDPTNLSRHPDEGTRFEVEYTYRVRPAGLTDFNPGSVIGTLVRAAARELKLLYEQMDEAYRRAFIDQASGVALDNVVALLGVERNLAIKAHGHVTFSRKKATTQDVTIPSDTRIADESGRIYVTGDDATLKAEAVEFRVLSNGSLTVTDKIAELIGIWRRDVPDTTPPVADKNTAGLQISADERSIILPDTIRPSGELRIRYKTKSVTVPVAAHSTPRCSSVISPTHCRE